jgi:hypothetical protein
MNYGALQVHWQLYLEHVTLQASFGIGPLNFCTHSTNIAPQDVNVRVTRTIFSPPYLYHLQPMKALGDEILYLIMLSTGSPTFINHLRCGFECLLRR